MPVLPAEVHIEELGVIGKNCPDTARQMRRDHLAIGQVLSVPVAYDVRLPHKSCTRFATRLDEPEG
jgi:hypothetical protein